MRSITPFSSMIHSLNRWPSFWDDDDFPMLTGNFTNNLDLYETDSEVVVKANVAGVDQDEIDVTFENGVLWIKAQKTESEEDEKNKYFSKSSWDYSYKVSIPGMLDSSKEPELDLKDGVLMVRFYKSTSKQPKKLTINKK